MRDFIQTVMTVIAAFLMAFVVVAFPLSLMALWIFILGLGVQLLWNWLVPDILGGTTITIWQAMGLLVLAHLLGAGLRSKVVVKEKEKPHE